MTAQQKSDVQMAAASLGRAIEEIVFCTVHPQLTGPHRRNAAIQTFAEVVTDLLVKAGR